MILISVKSDFMDVKRQFETDKEAEKYLKTVNKLHDTQRKYLLQRYVSKAKSSPSKGMIERHSRECLPLKVEIINTKHAQLNFATALK